MSLAIFILPKGDLRSELVRWKERVKDELPNQPYATHPPHMTLINLEVRNEEEGIATVLAFSSSIDPFQISVKRTDVFWDDVATGGHTLFFGIEKNDALFALQQLVADALLGCKKNGPVPDYSTKSKQFLKSYYRYGFPFVGDHWIPHFSVSSLRTEKTHPIITKFLSTTKQFKFITNQISLWRVNGDEHTQLETVYF